MYDLSLILGIIFIISLLFSFLSLNSKMSAMELVNNMGIGWNMGNTFDCYSPFEEIINPNDSITLWGNSIPTKDLIINIKKYGIKTIRLPITWMNFMDKYNKVNIEWISKIQEIVEWIINLNMYCIINIHHDGSPGNWLSEGIVAKNKYIFLWTQISNKFKDYNEQLIFESMNDIEFLSGDNYDFKTLFDFNQAFVNIIRNSGGNNFYRLLIISGMNKEIPLTCSQGYKIPIDPANKLAVSIHYHVPSQFCLEPDDNPWTWTDDIGEVHIVEPMTTWGKENDYNDMISYFETIKETFLDKGIPVIITEVSTLTEQKKDPSSIREFLHAHFSMVSDYKGIMSCLWDVSNKKMGESNFYDRENNKWYDEEIGKMFKKISRGKYVKPTEFYYITNSQTETKLSPQGYLNINIGKQKVNRVIFNVKISENPSYVGFGIASNDNNENWVGEIVRGEIGKKQYDGTFSFEVDISNKDYNDFIEIQIWWGFEYIISVNYLTVEYKENRLCIDYKSYKKALSY